MTEQSNSIDQLRAVLVIIATIAVILLGGLSFAGIVNHVGPGVIWDKYGGILTPARYAFSIWGPVYLGLTAFSFYQFLPANYERFRPIRTLYIVSCALNGAYVYSWHYEQVAIGFVFLIALLGTLLLIYIKLRGCHTFAETWVMQAPFGLYMGWVAALSIMYLTVLPPYLGMQMSPAAASIMASALIVTGALSAIVVRIGLRNFFYPLAMAWALTAIAIKQSGNTAIVVSAAFGVVICLVTTGSFVVHLRDSTSE